MGRGGHPIAIGRLQAATVVAELRSPAQRLQRHWLPVDIAPRRVEVRWSHRPEAGRDRDHPGRPHIRRAGATQDATCVAMPGVETKTT